jgi:Protein of unknown function (DUF5672)
MTHKELVAVVVPIYKADLTPAEALSWRQCLAVLHAHPIIVVKPRSLEAPFLSEAKVQVEMFDDAYFESTDGYNKLLTSTPFYEAFLDFKYILIYQLDAFVFADNLVHWCHKNLDYVGAPCFESEHWHASRFSANYDNSLRRILLNGGLSLRHVRACRRLLRVHNFLFGAWPGNEDMFFSLTSTRLFLLRWLLRLPSGKQAVKFAFEQNPRHSFRLNGQQLPFGCHAWERYDPAFWEEFIPQHT